MKAEDNMFTLPSGLNVYVTDPTPSKLFNYYVQSLEVVNILPKLEKVLKFIEPFNGHIILYTYDSILLDIERFDEAILREIENILSEESKFPLRLSAGVNYDDMHEFILT